MKQYARALNEESEFFKWVTKVSTEELGLKVYQLHGSCCNSGVE